MEVAKILGFYELCKSWQRWNFKVHTSVADFLDFFFLLLLIIFAIFLTYAKRLIGCLLPRQLRKNTKKARGRYQSNPKKKTKKITIWIRV